MTSPSVSVWAGGACSGMLGMVARLLIACGTGSRRWAGQAVRTVTVPCAARPLSGHASWSGGSSATPDRQSTDQTKGMTPVALRVRPRPEAARLHTHSCVVRSARTAPRFPAGMKVLVPLVVSTNGRALGGVRAGEYGAIVRDRGAGSGAGWPGGNLAGRPGDPGGMDRHHPGGADGLCRGPGAGRWGGAGGDREP